MSMISVLRDRRQFVHSLIPIALAPFAPGAAAAQSFSLQSTDGLTLRKVKAEPVTYRGRKSIRITSEGDDNGFAIVNGTEFQDGTIEIDRSEERRVGKQL